MVFEPGPSLAQAVNTISIKKIVCLSVGVSIKSLSTQLVLYNNIVYLEKYMGIPRTTLQDLNTLTWIESARSFGLDSALYKIEPRTTWYALKIQSLKNIWGFCPPTWQLLRFRSPTYNIHCPCKDCPSHIHNIIQHTFCLSIFFKNKLLPTCQRLPTKSTFAKIFLSTNNAYQFSSKYIVLNSLI